MKKSFAVTAVLALLCMVGGSAFAGWTVVNLNPAGTDLGSYARGVSGGQQVGSAANIAGYSRAGLWSGTAGTWVDLHPVGATNATNSCAYGVSGGKQVGYAQFYMGNYANYSHAGLWSGTAASWVDLHPGGWADDSVATGVSGTTQVGWVDVLGAPHASRWSGTAGSWVDLHPYQASGCSVSFATGVSGGQQVGWAGVLGKWHASLWNGSAASWVDLNPAGAEGSQANGVSGGQQAGLAVVGGNSHAGLWSGTKASWVDLNPAGATDSQAFGVSGGQQVGYVGSHAALWSGTAESWVDLHALLPAGVYRQSQAQSVDVSAGETWVAGCAWNSSTGQPNAMLWHYAPDAPIPEPSSLIALAAGLISLLGVRRRRA